MPLLPDIKLTVRIRLGRPKLKRIPRAPIRLCRYEWQQRASQLRQEVA